MNRSVRAEFGCYQVFWIDYPFRGVENIVLLDWVHVMHEYVLIDLKPINPEIATKIPDYGLVSGVTPLV